MCVCNIFQVYIEIEVRKWVITWLGFYTNSKKNYTHNNYVNG